MTLTASKSFARSILSFGKDESGATAIEYGLFAALIAAVIVGSVATLGTETNSSFSAVSSAMSAATEQSGEPVDPNP